MNWILQDKTYGFGNFINLTPVIKWIYENTNKPVLVYFETDFVRKAYEGHLMIEVLDTKPSNPCIATSRIKCPDNSQADYEYIFKFYTGKDYTNDYKPFVHIAQEYPKAKNESIAVLIIGSGSERQDYLDSKMIDREAVDLIRKHLYSCGYRVFFTGSENDYKRIMPILCKCEVGDIQKSLALIEAADIVIGNDTGLIHAAGTMDKEMFVLWKDTEFPRCKNSGNSSTYIFDNYLDGVKFYL